MSDELKRIFKDSNKVIKPSNVSGDDIDFGNNPSSGEFFGLDDLIGSDPEQFDESLLKQKVDFFNKVKLNVDYSSFLSHSFFSNANELLQVAIEKIFTQYPLTSSIGEIEDFYESLSGYEKHVFNNWPKVQKGITYNTVGYGVVPSGSNSYLLNPQTGSWTVEFYINPHSIKNSSGTKITGSSPVLYKLKTPLTNTSKGWSVYLSASNVAQTSFNVIFQMKNSAGGPSGSFGSIDQGKYSHVALSFDGSKKFKSYIDGVLNTTINSGGLYTNDDCITDENLTICSGGQDVSNLAIDPGGYAYTADTKISELGQLSASIDNIRIWNNERDSAQIKRYYNQNILSQTGSLVAYFKMNNLFEMPDRI